MNGRTMMIVGVCLMAMQAFAAQNLATNGTFEKGGKKADGWEIGGWNIRLADYMPKEEPGGEEGAKTYRYICGCGKDLGTFKPWCGLFCPQCKGFIGGEEAGDWYLKNHERVSLDVGPSGRCIKFTLPKDVGENQGVRVYSDLIKAKKGWGYKLSFDAKTKGSIARLFVECYRDGTAAKYRGNPELDPTGTKLPIERIFRAHINCGSLPDWQHFTKDFVAPKRYQFDWMTVKPYAYMPGEAWFDNVVLVPMTQRELDAYLSSKPKPKDDRFDY